MEVEVMVEVAPAGVCCPPSAAMCRHCAVLPPRCPAPRPAPYSGPAPDTGAGEAGEVFRDLGSRAFAVADISICPMQSRNVRNSRLILIEAFETSKCPVLGLA